MEGETNVGSVDVEVNLSENKVDEKVDGDERDITINNDLHLQGKGGSKEIYEDETVSDGEFIKVEKESSDIQEKCATNLDTDYTEKIKSLEIQLDHISETLHQSESDKTLLKSEVPLANEKFEKVNRDYVELQERMQMEISASEKKYSLQLESHQKTLGTLDLKHQELEDVKESFSAISAEVESSRKKMVELEEELASSATDARRLDELSNERTLHAEMESQRALELERVLELTTQSAKEMENQMDSLQEELKGMYNKIADSQQVEETLGHTTLELSSFQEKLKLSETKVEELEQKLIFKDDVIQEVAQELDMYKASEEKLKGEVVALENMLSTTKDDLNSKLDNLEDIVLKHQHEIKARETAEITLKDQEMEMFNIHEEMDKLSGEKKTLQGIVDDLNTNLSLTKELCSELEDKFVAADQNFVKADSLLSQALSSNAELEQKLKSIEELHGESRLVAETSSQRSLELEGLIQVSSVAEEKVREQLRENEMKLIAAEQQNLKLEEQLALAELKFNDADREVKALHEKTVDLTTTLTEVEEERALSRCHFQAYEDRVSQLEESSSKSSLKNSKLEEDLKNLSEMHEEHMRQSSAVHQRNVELEGLVHISNSKAEGAEKKVGELELLLETARHQTQEFEQLLCISETKCKDAETELSKHSSKVSELYTELETFQTKSATLEVVLHAANEKERDLTDMLNTATEKRTKSEETSNVSSKQLSQAEKLIEVLQTELKTVQEKLESVEEDLKASGARENEILEKLIYAENQLEHHCRAAEHASTRCVEIESLHESSLKDSELKLQESVQSLIQKDSEVKLLYEKVKDLEEQATVYRGQAVETTEEVASLKSELETSSITLASLEKQIEELNRKVSETEIKVKHSYSENELLAGTNSELRRELEGHQGKINELNEWVGSFHAEKEATAEQLASHVKTIEELSNQHSRGLELNSVAESRMKETEVQLQEALERLAQRDSEANEFNEKLFALDIELKNYKEQLGEVTTLAENRKVELEEAQLKMHNFERCVQETQDKAHEFEIVNESLAGTNMEQTQQLANYETKLNELETALNTIIIEKEDTSSLLHSSRGEIEDLAKKLASDGAELQSQISSVMEENAMLNKMYQNGKEELQAVMVHIEEQKGREISLCAEVEKLQSEIRSMELAAAEREVLLSSKLKEYSNLLKEKDDLNEHINNLQKDLNLSQTAMAEQKEVNSKMELEREAAMKQSLVGKEAESKIASLLEKQVEELKRQLQITEIQYKEKAGGGSLEADSKDGVEVKSRDLRFGSSSSSKRKGKKRSEGRTQAAVVAPVTPSTAAAQPSGLMAFKFILGAALISVIVGIILGKQYYHY